MPINKEEEIAVLYALHCCGGDGSKSQVVELIRRNRLLRPRAGDDDIVSSGEARIVNRIAWSRENLKRKGELTMPSHGIWRITNAGQGRLFRFVRKLSQREDSGTLALDDELIFTRLSGTCLSRLRSLGAQLADDTGQLRENAT